jgi:DNA end-binding protein Ku
MPPRAIASGTISFGLVSIPIKLFSTNLPASGIHFHLLHGGGCGSRLKQRYFCPREDVEVGRDDMVKGYEFAKDQYVTFTDDEIGELSEESTKAIEITEFVPTVKVDPLYFDKPYYVGPDKGGDRAYALLGEAMRKTGRAALAKYAARGKMYLVLLRAVDGGIVMQQLRYADEVRAMDEVPVGKIDIKDAELKLAVQFIEQLATDKFTPEAYEDEVRLRLLEAIQQKVDGKEVTLLPSEAPKAQIIDIMEALKASLAETAPKKTKRAEPAKKAAAAKKARSR